MNRAMSWMMLTLAVLGLCGGMALAGQTNSPTGPTDSTSMMWTLNDIYNVLDTRTTNVSKHATFKEPDVSAAPTMHTLDEVMALVTNRAPVAKTGQTNTYPTVNYVLGDDGTTRIGMGWPTNRFSPVALSGEETNQIRDNVTGLIWARNANIASNTTWATGWSSVLGTCTWYQAFDVITNYNGPVNGTNGNLGHGYGGTNDWRMPNVLEVLSLCDFSQGLPSGHPFVRVKDYYWTSTTLSSSPTIAWLVSFGYCSLNRTLGTKTAAGSGGVFPYLWPVRGGQQ